MLLNTKIFNQVVETAKAKCQGNAALLRAIDRAVYELNRSKYWAYDAQTSTLRLQSTSSRKLYIIDASHACEATTYGNKHCKHLVAHRLMQRYTEACGASVAEKRTARVLNWSSREGYELRETSRVTLTPLAA